MSAKGFSSQHLFIVANSWNVFSPLLLSELPVFRNKNALQLWQSGSQCITLWLWANQCWKNSNRLCTSVPALPLKHVMWPVSSRTHLWLLPKKHPSPCRPAAAGSSVLQHRSTRMIHTFPPLPQSICQADSKSCSYSTEQLKRIQHFTAIPLGITVSKPKLFLCGISSRI